MPYFPYSIPSLSAPSRPTPPCDELLQRLPLFPLSSLLFCCISCAGDAHQPLRFIRYLRSLLQNSFHLFNPLFQRFQHLQVVIQCLSSLLFPRRLPSNSSSTFYAHPVLYTYAPPSSLFIRRCFSCSHLSFCGHTKLAKEVSQFVRSKAKPYVRC